MKTPIVALAGLLLTGCAANEPAGDTAVPAELCTEPRPQVCTMQYDPVCATLADGSTRQYSNGCAACSDARVTGYSPGECPVR